MRLRSAERLLSSASSCVAIPSSSRLPSLLRRDANITLFRSCLVGSYPLSTAAAIAACAIAPSSSFSSGETRRRPSRRVSEPFRESEPVRSEEVEEPMERSDEAEEAEERRRVQRRLPVGVCDSDTTESDATDEVEVSVVGLRLDSEHEDTCCATLEFRGEAAAKHAPPPEGEEAAGAAFLAAAKKAIASGEVSKGSKPDRVMFGPIPKNFKGAVLIPDLIRAWKQRTGML